MTWKRCGRPTLDGTPCPHYTLRATNGCAAHLTDDERAELARWDAALAFIRSLYVAPGGTTQDHAN